jgi:hypothetical protein
MFSLLTDLAARIDNELNELTAREAATADVGADEPAP